MADDAVGVCTVTPVIFVHAVTTTLYSGVSLLQKGAVKKKMEKRACSSCGMKNSQFDACGNFFLYPCFFPFSFFTISFMFCNK